MLLNGGFLSHLPLLVSLHYLGKHERHCRFFETQCITVTCDGTALGGSMRIAGSHSPGGSTVTQSRNSSMPAKRSLRSRALYATS